MNPAGQLTQVRERGSELVRGGIEQAVRLVRISSDAGLREPHRARQAQKPLLCPVMEIALEMAALGVTRLHRPGARRGELLARIGVRERLGDKLGEALEALLGALGQRFRRTSATASAPQMRP